MEDRSDDTRTGSVYYRLGQSSLQAQQANEPHGEIREYLPKAGYASQFRMRFESTLSYALVLNLSLNHEPLVDL